MLALAFGKLKQLKKHLSDFYQPTIILDPLPAYAVLDAGDISTLLKVPRNTKPVPTSSSFLDVVHMDILFGP